MYLPYNKKKSVHLSQDSYVYTIRAKIGLSMLNLVSIPGLYINKWAPNNTKKIIWLSLNFQIVLFWMKNMVHNSH